MANNVVHFEIVGRDGAATQQFYGDLFDWQVNADNPMGYGVVSADPDSANRISGGICQAPGAKFAKVTIYVSVDDIAKYLAKVEKLGGEVLMEETEVMDGWTIGMFADPEGNWIGLTNNGSM